MVNNNKIILGLLAFAIVFGNVSAGQAQETKEQQSQVKTAAQQTKVPIVIEADQLSFSDETGDIFANGKVVITNQGQRVEADHIDGNTKLNEVWINDKATFSMQGTTPRDSTELTGSHTLYNYKIKTGSMEQAKGKVEHNYVSGQNISIFPDKYIINNGTTTQCPAKIPDYHISADKIEIWPGDHMIAYNAKFWIGNTVIFTMPKYRVGLKPGEGKSEFPRIGYDSDNGVYIMQHIEYPVNNKLSAYANLDYYTKVDFKPSVGLIQRESNYSVSVEQGNFQDSDSNWIKKEPEFKFSYYPHKLGNLPINYTFTASYGKWTDSNKTSWHQDYNLYFTHDPIKLNRTMNLYLGTGFERIQESYDNSAQNILKYDVTVDKKWSDRFSGWVGYHYTQNNKSLFSYGSDDLDRKLNAGFTYKIDKMNSIGITRNYNMVTQKVDDLDYIWYRNLHCWQATITYKSKESKIKFDISTMRW